MYQVWIKGRENGHNQSKNANDMLPKESNNGGGNKFQDEIQTKRTGTNGNIVEGSGQPNRNQPFNNLLRRNA